MAKKITLFLLVATFLLPLFACKSTVDQKSEMHKINESAENAESSAAKESESPQQSEEKNESAIKAEKRSEKTGPKQNRKSELAEEKTSASKKEIIAKPNLDAEDLLKEITGESQKGGAKSDKMTRPELDEVPAEIAINEEDFQQNPLQSTKTIFQGLAEVYMLPETGINKIISGQFETLHAEESDAAVINKAAIDLSLKCLPPKNENFIFSPCSAFICLAMYSSGLSGEGAAEMQKLLLPKNLNFDSARNYIEKYIDQFYDGYSLRFENLLLADYDSAINPALAKSLSKTYRALILSADFKSKSDLLEDALNRWVKIKTSGMIDSIIDKGDLDPETYLLLLSLVYFRDSWSDPFEESLTYDSQFKTGHGLEPVKMMSEYAAGSIYYEDEKAQYLKKHFSTYSTQLEFCLPKDPDADLQDFYTPFFQRDIPYESYTAGKFEMPICEIDSETDILDALKNMGISAALAGDSLQSIFEETVESPYISGIKQNSRIKINEEGAEAAAVTAMFAAAGAGMQTEPFEMILDRPFLFKLRRGSVDLFIGAVYNPVS